MGPMIDSKLRRRYVYMADHEWNWLKREAASRGVTVSSIIRGSAMLLAAAPTLIDRASGAARVLEGGKDDPLPADIDG